jgi:DinB family protein
VDLDRRNLFCAPTNLAYKRCALARLILRGRRVSIEALGGATAEEVAERAEAEGEREENEGGDGGAVIGVEQDDEQRGKQDADDQPDGEADGAANVGEVAPAQLFYHRPNPLSPSLGGKGNHVPRWLANKFAPVGHAATRPAYAGLTWVVILMSTQADIVPERPQAGFHPPAHDSSEVYSSDGRDASTVSQRSCDGVHYRRVVHTCDREERTMAEIPAAELDASQRRFHAGASNIEAEGTRYSLTDLADTLRATRGRIQQVVDTWSQAQLWAQPPEDAVSPDGEDRWSATEAVTHLIATQYWYRMHMWRLRGEKRMFDVMVRGLGDQAHNDIPKDALAAQLREATGTLLSEIDSIPADVDMTAQRDSTFFGMLSVRGWVYLAINHDLMHLAQIERLKTYSNFPTTK